MERNLKVTIDGWDDGGVIPIEYAFCVPDDQTHITMGQNRSPWISWSDVPESTASYVLICHDPDVPAVPDDLNREDRVISADLERMDFYHWLLVDIPANVTELEAGIESDGIVPGGKTPGATGYGVRGLNNYTDWFAEDENMQGEYGGYDGPCPPWNDERIHHYHFSIYALDIATIGMSGAFRAPEVLAAMKGHILAQGEWTGTYTLNPSLGEG